MSFECPVGLTLEANPFSICRIHKQISMDKQTEGVGSRLAYGIYAWLFGL